MAVKIVMNKLSVDTLHLNQYAITNLLLKIQMPMKKLPKLKIVSKPVKQCPIKILIYLTSGFQSNLYPYLLIILMECPKTLISF